MRWRADVDKDGIHHEIIVVKARMVEEFGYNCIHPISTQELANANSHYLCWLIRNEF